MAGIKRARKPSLCTRYLRCTLWLLTRARDLCVQSLTGTSGIYGNAMGCPTPQIASLPGSSGVKKSNAAAARNCKRVASGEIQAEVRRWKGAVAPVPAGSRTGGFGRIDEDRECAFGEDGDGVGLLGEHHVKNPKGRSYAVSRGK